MKKKLLFGFILLAICFLCTNVNALSRPTLYVTKNAHQQGDIIDDIEEEINVKTGEITPLYIYKFVLHDLPEDDNFGHYTIYTIPDTGNLVWNIDDDEIAGIDTDGKLRAYKKGTVTIRVCEETSSLTGTDSECITKDVEIELNSSCGPENDYKYHITLETLGGIQLEDVELCPTCSKIALYTGEDDSIVLPTPKRSGYRFDGWYTSTDYRTKITDIEKEYSKIDLEENYENYCPLYTYSGTLYAKWTATGSSDTEEEGTQEKVPVPDTALDSNKIIFIIGLSLAMTGFVIFYRSYKTKENN